MPIVGEMMSTFARARNSRSAVSEIFSEVISESGSPAHSYPDIHGSLPVTHDSPTYCRARNWAIISSRVSRDPSIV